jgi:hypothetical protein
MGLKGVVTYCSMVETVVTTTLSRATKFQAPLKGSLRIKEVRECTEVSKFVL